MIRQISCAGRHRSWPCAILGLVVVAGVVSLLAGGSCANQEAGTTPADVQKGEELFKANCFRCHGERGAGTAQGPPLVHKIYEPNHHADAAFQRAAASGVRAHHWQFGDMPKIDGVTPPEVTEIIRYVRWLQRQAGIY